MDSCADKEESAIRRTGKNAGFKNLEKVFMTTNFQLHLSLAKGMQ